MHALISFMLIEIEVLLGASALVIGYQLLSGKINLEGMLYDKLGADLNGYSPARLQLLVTTLLGAFYYASLVAETMHHPVAGQPFTLPDLPVKWLFMLGGSHSIYLGGKLNSLLGIFGSSDSANLLKGDGK